MKVLTYNHFNMLAQTLKHFFIRDLNKLKEEISLYSSETDIWKIPTGINNSAGTLCLHLVGNLNHFIGATLGNSGFIRERDLEFSLRNVPRNEMIATIDKAIIIVGQTFDSIKEEDMGKIYPLEKHGERVTTVHMLLHLMAHLDYHLGQINYHRRLIA